MMKTTRWGLLVGAGLFACTSLCAQQSSSPGGTAGAATPSDPVAQGASSGTSAPATSGATTPASSAPAASTDTGAAASANASGNAAVQVNKAAGTITVPSGTRLPLVLHNSITTRNAQPGDPLYFETTFPIVQNDRVLVPAGSYVQGEIIEAKRPGKVKGTGEVRVRLTTMILPNGYTVKFDAVPTNAGTGGNESTDKEGNIHGDTDKSTDVGTVAKTTGAGAGIGAIAGRSATGAGIGAGIGAAVGLAMVLMTRGPELELPRGTSVDIVLDRPLYLDASKINFTEPGRASDMPGPASREPVRNRSPF